MEVIQKDIKNKVVVRMTDGYGIARNFYVKDECPKCGAKLVKKGEHHGCYDGEWTWTDKVTCENKCFFYFQDLRKHNGLED